MEGASLPGDVCMLVGHVRDTGGRPVAGAEVTAVQEVGSQFALTTARTEFDGWFTLGPLTREVDYLLCVAPIADAGWTKQIPLRVPGNADPEDINIVVELGGTVVIRFAGLPVSAGDVTVRLLREDSTVAAASILGGFLHLIDTKVFGENWGCVETFRDLAPGTYRIEATTKVGPLPGTPMTVTISATEPTLVEIGRA